jgi:hypothetical protein
VSHSDVPPPEGKRTSKKRKPGEQATPHRIIEKRRRDRINHSLDELRAILPANKRSQGVRNDKVDLLQMTIDHLKELQQANKVSSNETQDAHPVGNGADHFRDIGFNECIQEAKKFLLKEELVDPADPLLFRLVSHLESRSRELFSTHEDPQSPVKRVAAEETVATDSVEPCVSRPVAGMNLNIAMDPLHGMNGLELISSVAENSRLTTLSSKETLQQATTTATETATSVAVPSVATNAVSSVAGTYQGLPICLPVNMLSGQRQTVAITTASAGNPVSTSTAQGFSPIPIALIANTAIGKAQTASDVPLAAVSQTQGNYYAYWAQPYVTNAWK